MRKGNALFNQVVGTQKRQEPDVPFAMSIHVREIVDFGSESGVSSKPKVVQ